MDDISDRITAGESRLGFIEILLIYLRLGLTSFGGPVAHLAYFHEEFVVRRRWLESNEYASLVALCQFLPGPASSQLGFAIGRHRGGLAGGVAAWLGFTLPSALLMMCFAALLGALADLQQSGWITGLKAGAVAVVAHAVWGLSGKLCTTRVTASIALVAAIILILLPFSWVQIAAIAAGGLCGFFMIRSESDRQQVGTGSFGWRQSLVLLGVFTLLLVLLPILAATTDVRALAYFDAFYRSGALVFGGGHVVLPLLQAEVVEPGWVSEDAFLAGYGAAQALPGPLFAFSSFLGYALVDPPNGITGGLLCLLAIFLPAILLLIGVQPVWEWLRNKRGASSAIAGINAAVVGLLLAALYNPVFLNGIPDGLALAIALAAFMLLQLWKIPAWAVVTTLWDCRMGWILTVA